MNLTLPTDSERSVVLGKTGTGKTVAAAWQLSLRSFDKMPWIIIDTKGDRLLNKIGAKEHRVGAPAPTRPGLYIVHPRPDELSAVNELLWEVYYRRVAFMKRQGKRLNNVSTGARAEVGTGFLFDEGFYITGSDAFRAILTRGRSLDIPTITCSQRPVWMDRFVFSEADHVQLFWLNDARDRKTVQSFMPNDVSLRLPLYHSTWYDVKADRVIRLAPVPDERTIVRDFRERLGKQRRVL